MVAGAALIKAKPEANMIARIHNNGTEIRVDLGNTGKNWPEASQPGFPWLSFGNATWQVAEQWAREAGADVIVRTGPAGPAVSGIVTIAEVYFSDCRNFERETVRFALDQRRDYFPLWELSPLNQ